MNIIDGIAEHPVVTVAAGLMTTTMGALHNFATDLPLVHDLLGIVAMLAGIIATLIGISVQIWRWKRDRRMDREDAKIKHLRQILLQREIDRGNNVTK